MSTGNTKYGTDALKSNAVDNSFSSAFGLQALEESLWINNTAVGAFSGANTTIGYNNVSMGTNSMLANTKGNYNTALGTAAMCNNVLGSNNTIVGANALENTTGSSFNTALGCQAGYNDTGNNNTFIGALADSNVAGISNSTAIGYNAKATASNQIRMGTATEQVSVPGTLSVSGNTTLNTLSLTGNFTTSTLTVTGATTLNSTLTVSGAATLNNNLTVSGTATLNGAIYLNGYVTVGGDIVMNNPVQINDATNMNGTLSLLSGLNLYYNITGITANTTLTYPFHQMYPVDATSAITITLPTPTLSMTGAIFMFKRYTSNAGRITFSGQCIPYNSITNSANTYLETTQYQTLFMCNGSIYYQLFTM